jgi:hypothetical protein
VWWKAGGFGALMDRFIGSKTSACTPIDADQTRLSLRWEFTGQSAKIVLSTKPDLKPGW